ncbi:MAG: CopG family transcriptional regulator [Candidatus Bathyarchaeia archaeon]
MESLQHAEDVSENRSDLHDAESLESETLPPLGEQRTRNKDVETLDENEPLKQVLIYLSDKRLKQLRKIAYTRGVSRASLVREAVEDWFTEQSNSKEKIPNELLEKILDYCSKDYGDGFEIDGDTGFVAMMQENKLQLKDLTKKQWVEVAKKIDIGFNRYFSQPSPEEFAGKFDPISPSKEQRAWLSSNENLPEDSEEEKGKE